MHGPISITKKEGNWPHLANELPLKVRFWRAESGKDRRDEKTRTET